MMVEINDVQIRKVRVLGDRARKEADRQGLEENDLVIVETIIDPFPKYKITKIEGSPIEFLQKKYLNLN